MQEPTIAVDRRRFAAVRRTAAYRAVAAAWDAPVAVACSGGVDSMALLATAAVAHTAGRVPGFTVVHVDHRVRAGSDREGRVVAAAARALGLPFVQLRLDKLGKGSGQGLEDALRAARYAALAGVGRRLDLSVVVTAHTRDDQIETILLRLLSGSSSLASAGMRRRQTIETECGPIEVLRPLLDVSRSDLVEVLELLDLPHLDDPSNDDLTFRRNRVRHRVIPELAALDPGFGGGLIRAVEHAATDARFVEAVSDACYQQVTRRDQGRVELPRGWLTELDPALATRVVRRAVLELIVGDSREMTAERTLAVIQAAGGWSGATIELPYGIVARIERDVVAISRVT